jgi:hypothetical protein
MSKSHLFVYQGPPGRLETVIHSDGTVRVCLVDDSGRTKRCLESLDSLEMTRNGNILIDPKIHFAEIIKDSKRMPEMVLNATLNRIQILSKAKDAKVILLIGGFGSDYPRKWFQPLLDELIFVETVDDFNS